MLVKKEQKNWFNTIKKCWEADPAIVQFSRNFEHDLDTRVLLEVEALLAAGHSFKLYDVLDDELFLGYFGIETDPTPWLTTIFVMPEHRIRKDEIWNFILTHLPEHFFSGLFKINHRAIRYFEKKGGVIIGESMAENKPIFIFEFRKLI